MKTCTKCKIEKQAAEFYKDKSRLDGLQSKCKPCMKSLNSSYYAKNYDSIADYQAKYRAENKIILNAHNARYHAQNKQAICANKAKYRSHNKELCLAHKRNRRARISGSEGRHTAADIARIFEHQRGLCANCHAKLFKSGRNKFHTDHIIPIAIGGSNWPSNLQCLCPKCNLSKGAKDPIAWAQQNGRLI